MSPGNKASAGLFVVAFPLMLYLTSPDIPLPAPVAPAHGVAGTVAVEPVPVQHSLAPATARVRPPETVNHTLASSVSERDVEPSVPAHAAVFHSGEPDAGESLAGYTYRETGDRLVATRVDTTPAMHNPRVAYRATAAVVPTQAAQSIADRSVPEQGPVAEEPAEESGESPYLPTAQLADDIMVEAAVPVDCSRVLYMNGNDYGRNMLIKMGCAGL